VELLIRARGGRFVEPGQPWLRTDDRGITWLDAEVIARYADAVSSGERHILALVEALALGKPLEDVAVSWPAWTPSTSVWAAGRYVFPRQASQPSTCDDPDRRH
jgi:hypothetical protein